MNPGEHVRVSTLLFIYCKSAYSRLWVQFQKLNGNPTSVILWIISFCFNFWGVLKFGVLLEAKLLTLFCHQSLLTLIVARNPIVLASFVTSEPLLFWCCSYGDTGIANGAGGPRTATRSPGTPRHHFLCSPSTSCRLWREQFQYLRLTGLQTYLFTPISKNITLILQIPLSLYLSPALGKQS